jgi:hypothetical protein
MTSFKDPAYAAKPTFKSVVVLTAGMGLEEKMAVESSAGKVFGERGARAHRGMDVVPPTRQMSDEQFVDALLATRAETVLIISAGEKGTSSTYVPPTYHPGQVYGTVNTVGNYSYFNAYQTPGYTTGGYSISKPNAVYSAKLFDMATGNVVWQADGFSRGNAFADYSDLAESMAEEAVKKLYDDQVF